MLTDILQPHGRIGLGGEGVLRTRGRSAEARAVIDEALGRGIRYFDSARVYADSELYYGAVWRERPETRAESFQTSKSASRDKAGALADLDSTLQRLAVDRLDLWQIHDVRTEQDLDAIAAPGGALEAFVEAKAEGRVRFIGVTGHHDPQTLSRAVAEWPVDAVLLPVNPAEAAIGGFLTDTLPRARQKGLAVIGMKVLGGGHYVQPRTGVSAEALIRFALCYDITLAVVGCRTPDEVRLLAQVRQNGTALSPEEKTRLTAAFTPHARQLAFYRGTI